MVNTPLLIETERLLLRPPVATDEDDMFVYQSDPDVVRYIPWPARTREQVREALEKAVRLTRLRETGDHVILAVVEKETAKVIGQCNLSIVSKNDKEGAFGYVISPSFAGRGFATEASRALLEFAFTATALHRITARIDTRNVASAAVAAKLGMRREAELAEAELFKGERSSTWIYVVLRTEWEVGGDL